MVIREFLSQGLIDDLTLSIIPVVPGDGICLLDRGLPESRLALEDVASFKSGLVQLRYRADRPSPSVPHPRHGNGSLRLTSAWYRRSSAPQNDFKKAMTARISWSESCSPNPGILEASPGPA